MDPSRDNEPLEDDDSVPVLEIPIQLGDQVPASLDELIARKPEFAKELVALRRRFQEALRQQITELVALRRVLLAKPSAAARKIIDEHPEIIELIEELVRDAEVGAGAWRSDDSLQWNGNKKVGKKMSWPILREEIKKRTGILLSIGTLFELSCARNGRRRSAVRFRNLINLRSVSNKKGFEVEVQYDDYYSFIEYQILGQLARDSSDLMVVNRDDASGIQTGSVGKNRQFKELVGRVQLTTRTDYDTAADSKLQTTSYLFPGFDGQKRAAAGIVKVGQAFPKAPSQHCSDFIMLQEKARNGELPDLTGVFFREDGGELVPKRKVWVQVDRGPDENFNNDEPRYYHVVAHMQLLSWVYLVTSRCPGSSYLNLVENMNGQLQRAVSGLFIPKTIYVPDPKVPAGEWEDEKARVAELNIRKQEEIYMDRCFGTKFGEATIALMPGNRHESAKAKNVEASSIRIFLSGTQLPGSTNQPSEADRKRRDAEAARFPDRFAEFQKVRRLNQRKRTPANRFFPNRS